ncbi:MAG: putative metal-binding motif-containing protein, partial [Planctomycetota bacterium]
MGCTTAADCVSQTPQACPGAWSCDQGACVWTCDGCQDGDTDTFGAGGGCVGPDCDDTRSDVYPGAQEVCDGIDNDCDGNIDEGLGQLTCGQGICQATVPACLAGQPQTCSPGSGGAESCGNGLDDDCDGVVDEQCACTNGTTQSCWTGPAAALGVGECTAGTQTCANSQWGACTGEGKPYAESCDGKDNDCDGTVDNNLVPPACDLYLGVCAAAQPLCQGTTGWAICSATEYGTFYEDPEAQCDDKDNNCDGTVDEGCACQSAGQTRPCGTNLGQCATGIQTCTQGQWSPCAGATA